MEEQISKIEKEVFEKERSESIAKTQQNKTYTGYEVGNAVAGSSHMPTQHNSKALPKEKSSTQGPMQLLILQNRCTALERGMNRCKEMLSQQKVNSSEKISKYEKEMDQLRERFKIIEEENDKLKTKQLNTFVTDMSQPRSETNNSGDKRYTSSNRQALNSVQLQMMKLHRKSLESMRCLANLPFSNDYLEAPTLAPIFHKNDSGKPKTMNEHLLLLQNIISEFVPLNQTQKEDFDRCKNIFVEFFKIVCDICECIKNSESNFELDVVKKTHFCAYISDLLSKEMLYEKESRRSIKSIGLNDDLQEDFKVLSSEYENKASEIKLIGMMAVLALQSATLSKMIASTDVSSFYMNSNTCSNSFTPVTLLDLFVNAINEFVLPLRKYIKYTGVIYGFATLACNISKFYTKFDDYSVIDVTLAKFFNTILRVAPANGEILLKLTEFAINLGQCNDPNRLFTKLCKNHPSKNNAVSKIYNILALKLCGCEFQILFMLIIHAFPDHETLPEHRVDLLLKLSEHLNDLTLKIYLRQSDLLFLRNADKLGSQKSSCSCLEMLMSSLIALHSVLFDNLYVNFEKNKWRIKNAIQKCFSSMSVLLAKAKKSSNFHDLQFLLNKLEYLYIRMKSDIYDNRGMCAFDFFFSKSSVLEESMKECLEYTNFNHMSEEQTLSGKSEEENDYDDLVNELNENVKLEDYLSSRKYCTAKYNAS